jgi:hypothetical protein
MAKVIRPGKMFFEDDVKIVDSEIDCGMKLPAVPVFSREEMQIIYNGHVFLLSRDKSDAGSMRVYTVDFGLTEGETPKAQEDKYFSDNAALFDKLKLDFLERAVNGVSIPLDGTATTRMLSQVGKELADRVAKAYEGVVKSAKQTPAGKGLISKLNDGSVFNSEMQGCERVLLLDGRAYDLMTIAEYVETFRKSIEPGFYKDLQEACKDKSPEEVSKLLTDNKAKVHRKALNLVRNKIWHSDRSSKLFLDGGYWIPRYRDKAEGLAMAYQKLLEKKLKIEAGGSIK